MAITHFAVLAIEQTMTRTGYKIVVTTDVPCHLYMRWTTKPPWIHHVPVLLRGVEVSKDIRICFTVYEDNEQLEPGFTTEHTFIKEPWASCETRWFYFYGFTSVQPTPSTSPIFKKHRLLPPYWLLVDEPWTISPIPPPMSLVHYELWPGAPTPPGFYYIFWEPWGTKLTQYNPWYIPPHLPTPVIVLMDGIITIQNIGHPDCSLCIFNAPWAMPLLNGEGEHLYVHLNCPSATPGHISSLIVCELWLRSPKELHMIQLIIAGAPIISLLAPYGVLNSSAHPYGWKRIGLGDVFLDITALWQQMRSDIGLDNDPTQWEINYFNFGLLTSHTLASVILQNDFIGFGYPT